MKKILYKSVDDSVQDVDDKSRVVKNVLNRTEMVDSDGDIIKSNAFNKTIKELGPKGKNLIVHLTDHIADHAHLIGKFSDLYMLGKDLIGVTHIPNTTLGNDILELYKTGNINQHSIGFNITKSEKTKQVPLVGAGNRGSTYNDNDDESNIFYINDDKDDNEGTGTYNDDDDEENPYANIIREVRLYEGSAVLYGANDQTPNISVGKALKSMTLDQKIDHFDKLMKSLDSLYNVLHKGKISDETGELLQLRYIQIQDQLHKLFKSISTVTQPEPKQESVEPIKEKENEEDVYQKLLLVSAKLKSL